MRKEVFDPRSVANFHGFFRGTGEFFQSPEIKDFDDHVYLRVILPELGEHRVFTPWRSHFFGVSRLLFSRPKPPKTYDLSP